MKLSLGDNIRTFRRAMDMTQEQLAVQLGVSFQSVSRWENGTTYPDMELLPVLARIFSVTVDALLGMNDEEQKKNFEEVCDRLKKELYAEVKNEEAIVELLRELRRDYIEFFFRDMYYFTDFRNSGAYKMPAVLAEMRRIAEEVLQRCGSNFVKGFFIEQMAEMEDGEHILPFLRQNATAADLSGNALLRGRYEFRGETEKLEKLRQVHLYEMVHEFCTDRSLWGIRGRPQTYPADYCRYVSEAQLSLLHGVCGIRPDPEHPVTGNGSLDLFVDERLNIGVLYAACCAGCGETELALTVLEDWVSLFEQIMAAPEGHKLSCTSPAMGVFTPAVEPFWAAVRGHEERFGLLHDSGEHGYYSLCESDYFYGESYGLFDPSGYYGVLTGACGSWERFDSRWLDSIREEPRFKAVLARLHALIETRELTGN